MKTLTEYYEDKLNGKQNESPLSQQSAYDLLKHYYTNPLSLKELCRIHIRNKLLEIDFKLKDKIQTQLPLPIRIKNYLLFNCIYIYFYKMPGPSLKKPNDDAYTPNDHQHTQQHGSRLPG